MAEDQATGASEEPGIVLEEAEPEAVNGVEQPQEPVRAAEEQAQEEIEVGEWYYQEPTTKQPAGPWTIEQLRKRWRNGIINGLTPVWKQGLEGWNPLAEVEELKDAIRATDEAADADDAAEAEEPLAKRRRRSALDEIPLTHTFTNEHGVLYVFDEVDDDWKASDVYEALWKEEQDELKEEGSGKEGDGGAKKGSKNGTTQADELDEEAQKAFEELMEEASKSNVNLGMVTKASAAVTRKRNAAAAAGEVVEAPAQAAPAPAEALPPEKEAKRQKRKDYRDRKKLKKQAGLFLRTQENPNVYVSGLPPDVTLEELEPIFKRAGVIKVDLDSGEAKIRIYTEADGMRCKGDALVSYANAASVELAVQFLHEHEIRPGCRICVQQADFEEHEREQKLSKEELQELAAAKKKDGSNDGSRARYIAAKNLQKEAVSWSCEMDDGSGRRIVVLRHLFSKEEAETEGLEFYQELADEVKEECEKIGQVAKVTPIQRHKQGIVCVKFKSSAEAEECIRVMDGRYFAGRTVEASLYDGKTDLKVLGVSDSKALPPLKAAPAQAAPKAAPPNPAEVTVPPTVAAGDAAGAAEAPVASEPAGPETSPAASAPAEANGKSWEEFLNGDDSDDDEELKVREEE